MNINLNSRKIPIFLIITALMAGAYQTAAAQTVSQTDKAASTLHQNNGMTVITLSKKQQKAVQIIVSPLKIRSLIPSKEVYSTVIDLKPLFDLRNRWSTAKSLAKITQIKLKNAEIEYRRSEKLFKQHHDTSLQTLQKNEVQVQSYQAERQSQQRKLNDIVGIIHEKYGSMLAQAVTKEHSPLIRQLLIRSHVVVSVPVPDSIRIRESKLPMLPATLSVTKISGEKYQASKLSESPQTDPFTQGSPYLYLVPTHLPVGLRISTQIPVSDKILSGYIIPGSAIVWYAGQPWIYIQTADNHFIRQALGKTYSVNGGDLSTTVIEKNLGLVTQGAQTLLSEEQKQQTNTGSLITSQCPDPPECDG